MLLFGGCAKVPVLFLHVLLQSYVLFVIFVLYSMSLRVFKLCLYMLFDTMVNGCPPLLMSYHDPGARTIMYVLVCRKGLFSHAPWCERGAHTESPPAQKGYGKKKLLTSRSDNEDMI